MVKISVIIPSYNHEKYIKQAINSVLNQTYQNFEIIILDDCSKDKTKKILKNYKDERIKILYNQTNIGAVNTLNNLIDLANGEYIALLNSDDYWEKTKLEKQIDLMEKNKEIAACFTWADFVDNHNKLIVENKKNIFQKENRKQEEWLRFFFDYGNCLCHPSVMIRKKVYDEIGKYNKIYRQLPDYEFWIRLIKKYNIHIIEENLTHFRIIENNEKNTSYLSDENKNLIVYENYAIKIIFFNNLDKKLFYKSFEDIIKNKNCIKNDVLIKFEQGLILYNCKYYPQISRFIGYKKIGEILSQEKNANYIEDNYNFTIKDYYKLGENMLQLDNIILDSAKESNLPDYIKNSRYFKLRTKLVQAISKLKK